jgi:ribonuclease HI
LREYQALRSENVKLYVVIAPSHIRGVFESWKACEAAVSSVGGAIYQAVSSREEAEAILSGRGIRLPPGVYAFTDGNHLGGVGVVFVMQRATGSVIKQLSTDVHNIFSEMKPRLLPTPRAVDEALSRLRNVLSEVMGLYKALDHIAPATELSVVYDYEGVASWLFGKWKAKDPLVAEIVSTCRDTVDRKSLVLHYVHQQGHHSSYAARNDFAFYNNMADSLAKSGVGTQAHIWK